VVDAEEERELQRVGVAGERLVQDAVLADPFEIDPLIASSSISKRM